MMLTDLFQRTFFLRKRNNHEHVVRRRSKWLNQEILITFNHKIDILADELKIAQLTLFAKYSNSFEINDNNLKSIKLNHR